MNPIVLPIFLPHAGCLHRCLYCNQRVLAGSHPSPETVRNSIATFLRQYSSHFKGQDKQVAFYGGSFTAMSQDDQVSYLQAVQPFIASGQVQSIRLSTRPDALGEETLKDLKRYRVRTVEVGIQSMSDEVLILSKRGHTARDASSAILRLKDGGFEVGVHLMVGLPGDSCDGFLRSLDQVIELKPHFVRIHPTLVLRGSLLEDHWKGGAYIPLSLEEAIHWLKKGLLRLKKAGIPLVRIGLQSTRELEEHLLAGPYHPALRQLVESAIFYDLAEDLLKRYIKGTTAVFLCHPKDESNLKGQRGENFRRLKDRFNLTHVSILPREDFGRGKLGLQLSGGEVFVRGISSIR